MEFFRKLVFRATAELTVPAPFGARSAGHYRLEETHREKAMRKDFVQLFWGLEGQGEFRLPAGPHVLGPEQVFVYLPGDAHDHRPVGGAWHYRWLTLDGPMNSEIVKSFGLGRKATRGGPCPEDLFTQLEGHIADVTPHGELRACAAAFAILAASCGRRDRRPPEDRIVEECLIRIDRDFADPELTVESVAAGLDVHRSSLCRAFKGRVGVSPQQYLISTRMQKAMSLLKETDLQVSEVARATGYPDPNYFARAMKKTVGMAPLEFRRQ